MTGRFLGPHIRAIVMSKVFAFAGFLLAGSLIAANGAMAAVPQGEACTKTDGWRLPDVSPGPERADKLRDCGAAKRVESDSNRVRLALNECKTFSLLCQILGKQETRRKPPVKPSGGMSARCRNALENWRTKPKYRAFVSTRGGRCHASWGHGSVDAAVAKARSGCANKRDCRLLDIGADSDVVKDWQYSLQLLGLYDDDIDGKWGPDSKTAMKKFAQRAELKRINTDAAFERLKWASRMVAEHKMPVNQAIAEADIAAEKGSLDYLQRKMAQLKRLGDIEKKMRGEATGMPKIDAVGTFNGRYRLSEQWTCEKPGSEDGSIEIAKNALTGLGSFCQMSNPEKVRGIDAVLFDFSCIDSEKRWNERVMIVKQRSGIIIVSGRGGDTVRLERCP